jgi:outer membrane lipoprotein carrier protein
VTLLSLGGTLGVGGAAAARVPEFALSQERGNRIAESLRAAYERANTFRASFRQSHVGGRGNTGWVTFRGPGQFAFRYENGNRVVSDGELVRVYDKKNNRMFEQLVETSQYPTVLSFLLRQASLEQWFELTELDPKRLLFQGALVLQARPREASPAYRKMLLYIDSATYEVRRVLLLDEEGNRNRFDFSRARVNHPIQAREFVLVPSSGMAVIRL